jgi:hypothetical protein
MKTNNYNIPMLLETQALKEQTINKALMHVDGIMNKVINGFVDALPEEADDGSIFILTQNRALAAPADVRQSPSEVELCKGDNKMAFYSRDHGWITWQSAKNTIWFVLKEMSFYLYDGVKWQKIKT